MKKWYKKEISSLSKEAIEARLYIIRICNLLTKLANREFYVKMSKRNNDYEGHIIDTGKCIEVDPIIGTFALTIGYGEDIGMIFWGGHFSLRKHKDAKSKAWISLLEDCIGNSEGGKFADCHNLTDHLKQFGPKIDLNCKTTDKLEELLKLYET